MRRWKTLASAEVLRAAVFRYEKRELQSEDTGARGTFDIVSCADWVNVIALTDKEEFIFVRQYRAGADDLTLELPAGALNRREDPLLAAQRELREESGFTSSEWTTLGSVVVNPAFMTNTCHVYLARNCVRTHELELDPLEEIEVVLMNHEAALKAFRAGVITHSLCVASLGLALLKGELKA